MGPLRKLLLKSLGLCAAIVLVRILIWGLSLSHQARQHDSISGTRKIVLAPLQPALERAGKITNYRLDLATIAGRVSLRSFAQGGRRWRLAVDQASLKTMVVPDEGAIPVRWAQLPPSPWLGALHSVIQHDAALEDSGLTHLLPKGSGVVLTVDLCPSRKPFNFLLLQEVIDVFESEERPVPIAFAISGVWLKDHKEDVARLRVLEGKDLTITWINHSMHHRFSSTAPLTRNFLLEPGTNIKEEVFGAEIAMLEAGLTPSVFFRFPGLISDSSLVAFLTSLGLVSVGSDAWLAKGQRPTLGSVVLVHGNGNEPEGVHAFFDLLRAEKKKISKRQFLLLDLSASVQESFL